MPQNDGLEVIRIGHPKVFVSDLYAQLLGSDWIYLALYIGVIYTAANLLFASLYIVLGDGIANARPGSFQDAFFFSVQTMATIGYGQMFPTNLGANILVTLEALFGFAFFAIVTGMVFAKLSRPSARVLFSKVAVIGPYEGKPYLMMRLANERGNLIVDATIQLVVLLDEVTKEGARMRRFHDLTLTRSRVPLMRYTWTVMHAIDENSRLFNMSQDQLRALNAEIIISLTGIDQTYAQTIHTRHSYVADEIHCNAVFEDILQRDEMTLRINFEKFHETRALSNEEI